MIEVSLDGYRYYYHKGEEKGCWMGFGGYKGSLSRTPHCSVPTSMWKELKETAVKTGYSNDDFVIQKTESENKSSSGKSSKSKKNSISIFSQGE